MELLSSLPPGFSVIEGGAAHDVETPTKSSFVRSPLYRPLTTDFRKVVEEYTADEELFFKDFAAAFAKLISLGTPSQSAAGGGGGLLDSFLAMIGMGK